MFKFIYFFMIVVAGTAGELCVSRAMKETGEVKDFRPRAVIMVILRALRVKWMGIGVGLMTLAFFSLLAVSLSDSERAMPVAALPVMPSWASQICSGLHSLQPVVFLPEDC